ncbi:transcriptional regulator [Halomonas caseinilytica]|uniref:transcriptional regulator n=1 Tax=Halomonas caseinilytica TaxID=438744 RepID=UPI0009443B1B
MCPRKALEKAIKKAGSQTALARSCGVSQQAVQQWVATGKVPATRVMSVVSACSGAVSALDLRPDVFGERSAA